METPVAIMKREREDSQGIFGFKVVVHPALTEDWLILVSGE